MLTHESVEPTYRGHHCSGAPDFGAMGLKAGDHVTIQARWMAGTAKTTLYSCADITLVDPANYIQPRSAMCFNGALDEATVDMNNYTDAGPKSGLSGVSPSYSKTEVEHLSDVSPPSHTCRVPRLA